MNKASRSLTNIINTYCSVHAIASIASSSFIPNLIENFGRDFNDYLINRYQIKLVNASALHIKTSSHNADDLYLLDLQTNQYRLVTQKDISIIYATIRKWYQDFDDINLRIKLLFDSKYGTKFLASKTGVDADLISKARHGHYPISKISGETRLKLENFYLNSELAVHIRRLKVNFDKI